LNRFIALRYLQTKHGPVKPGESVDVAGWSDGVIVSEINAGNIFDLDRKYRLSESRPTQLRREADLLAALADFGKAVEFLTDGTCELVDYEDPDTKKVAGISGVTSIDDADLPVPVTVKRKPGRPRKGTNAG
jgi:hypothetical protein